MTVRYTYPAHLVGEEGDWLVELSDFDNCFAGGATVQEACENAAARLRTFVEDYAMRGEPLPEAAYESPAQVVLYVEFPDPDVEELPDAVDYDTAAELAGVSRPYVSTLVKNGRLEAVPEPGTRRKLVTRESLERFRSAPRRGGRPRKNEQAGK